MCEKPGKFTKAGPNTNADPKYLKHPIGGANTKCAQRHFEILKILPLPVTSAPSPTNSSCARGAILKIFKSSFPCDVIPPHPRLGRRHFGIPLPCDVSPSPTNSVPPSPPHPLTHELGAPSPPHPLALAEERAVRPAPPHPLEHQSPELS